MTKNGPALTPVQRAARLVVQRELQSYDLLSKHSKIVYERKADEVVPTFLDRGIRACAHGVMLHEPCTKCERSVEDCKQYEVALRARVAELLKLLD